MPSTRRNPEAPEAVLRRLRRGSRPAGDAGEFDKAGAGRGADRPLPAVRSLHRRFGARQIADLVQLAVSLGLAPQLAAQVASDLSHSTTLHFGFEREGERTTLKLYCRVSAQTRADSVRGPCDGLLVHRAVKWDPRYAMGAAVSYYVANPARSVFRHRRRIRDLLGQGPPGDLALGLFHRAAGRVPAEDRLFLEVTEEGGVRRIL